jgi:hypothetical protein
VSCCLAQLSLNSGTRTDGLDFPIWVAVYTNQSLTRFVTFMQKDLDGGPFTAAAANHANATIVLPTFYLRCDHKDRLCSNFVMTFADGVIDTHVITAARRIAGA